MKKNILIAGAFVTIFGLVVAWFLYLDSSVIRRPQTPEKPYPYYSEDVRFKNDSAHIELAGTLTLPSKEGKYPVVVLISGSGPQNRDEEILGHKPFLILADHLAKKGIGVLRYDKRGIGQSTGNYQTATSLDFSYDAESAVRYLQSRKDIDSAKIGLMGSSEGGLIAPMIAARTNTIHFMVLLAGPAMPLMEALLLQGELVARAYGVPETEIKTLRALNREAFTIVAQSKDLKTLKEDITHFSEKNISKIPLDLLPKKMTREQYMKAQIEMLSSPWFQFGLQYDPAPALRRVKCPVLALIGSKDLQVPPKENLNAVAEHLKEGGNPNVTIKELPNLNHLFQECETGSPKEYEKIEQTFSPIALNEISGWILERVK